MTTIAVRIGKDFAEMAADTRACGVSILQHPIQKVREYEDCLVGFAGTLGDAMGFVHWLENSGDPDDWPASGFDCTALVLTKHGKRFRLHCYEAGQYPYELGKVAAIGSGGDYAMVAMEYGASPREAIKTAMKYDQNTGGRVTAKRIET